MDELVREYRERERKKAWAQYWQDNKAAIISYCKETGRDLMEHSNEVYGDLRW